MRYFTVLLTALSISSLVAIGCGQNETASSSASLAPSGAVMYGEFDIRPEGDQKQAIDAILAKFPGGAGAGERLEELIEEGLRDSDAGISYAEDIEPWLGDEGAFFLSGDVSAGELADGAALVATDDEDAARDAIEKSFKEKPKEKSYNDVDYWIDGESAVGVFDGFVVLGSERGLKDAIDTADGGAPLADDEEYTKALDAVSDDRLGVFYINMPKLYAAVQNTPGAQMFGSSFKRFFAAPYVVTVDADNDGVTFETTVPGEVAQAVPFLGQGGGLVEELPADSWLAMGQPDIGKLVDSYVGVFGDAVGGRDVIEQQFRSATGLDLRDDVTSWMGDAAVFVRGTGVAELNGALVVETTDPRASLRLINRLGRLARAQAEPGDRVAPLSAPGGGEGFTLLSEDIPQPIHVLQRDDRMVVAYGDAAAADALEPAQSLGDSPEFQSAAQSLDGYGVSMYFAMAPILELADNAGASANPEWQQVRPYLEPLSALVAGSSGDTDDLRSAFKIVIE